MIPWQAFIKSCKIIESIATLGTTLIISPSILEKSLATVHASLGEIWSPTPLCSVEKLKCVQRVSKSAVTLDDREWGRGKHYLESQLCTQYCLR